MPTIPECIDMNCSYCFGRGCDQCETLPIADIPIKARVSSDTVFVGADSYGYKMSSIQAYLLLMVSGGEVSKTVTAPYTVLESDKLLRVTGTGNVTIPANREIKLTVYAVDGLDFVDENSNPLVIENKPSNLAAGDVLTLYWDKTLSGYFAA